MGCDYKLNKLVHREVIDVTVGKINIDEERLNAEYDKLTQSWDQMDKWYKTATPEQVDEARKEYESWGGGH